ncbi:MAG: hypothetical protein AB7O68_16120 [Pirellulales bacterium]
MSGVSQEERVADLGEQASQPPDHRRLVALALLSKMDREAASALARQWMANAESSAKLRRQAFVVLLHTVAQDEARRSAVEALNGADDANRELALRWLALGPSEGFADEYHDSVLRMALDTFDAPFGGSSAYDPLPALAELEPQVVEQLANDESPVIRALASYALLLRGDDGALERLLAMQDDPFGDSNLWRRLSYRAIAVTNSDEHGALLTRLYELLRDQDADLRDFYWTIRAMTVPSAVELRKRMRAEVGMDQLR